MTTVQDVLTRSAVIPVVKLQSPAQAVAVARALLDNGVSIIEVTLRTPTALQCMRAIRAEVPDMLVVAGTVCTANQYRESVEAGAAAIVSPGITPMLGEFARNSAIPWLPGVASASEILLGLELGLQRFKLFPASVAGGPEALRAFYGPFPDVRFCPTGGIDRASVAAYLQLPNVDCVGATWVVPDTMVAAADWAGIGANARFVAQLRSVQP